MFEQKVLRVIGYHRCDAFACDNESTTGMDVRHETAGSEREYWCDDHAKERRQQVSKHSKLRISGEYILVDRDEYDG